jgi:hypothetical protein
MQVDKSMGVITSGIDYSGLSRLDWITFLIFKVNLVKLKLKS